MASKSIRGAPDLSAPLDDAGKDKARTIIANMIVTPEQVAEGMISRIREQGKHMLMPDMLPRTEMPFERLVLRVLYSLEESKLPATQDRIFERVSYDFGDNAGERLQALLDYRTLYADITTLSFSLGDWMERQRMLIAAREVVKLLESREDSSQGAFDRAMQIMSEVAPRTKASTSRDGKEMRLLFEQDQEKRKERLLKGVAAGPTWPWKAFREKVPNFKKGEMALLMAESKGGKSTIGLLLAEHVAYGHIEMRDPKTWPKFDTHEQEDGYYDVLLLHLETSHTSFNDRIRSRHLVITPADLRNPAVVDIEADPWKTKYDKVEKVIEACENTRGKVYYDHCPGMNHIELKAKVAQFKAQAEARGRELVVIVDYYTQIDWTGLGRNQTEGYNAMANWLKEVAEQEEVYMWVFAQYGVDSDMDSKKASFGGQVILHRAQVVVRVEREVAKEDFQMLASNGKPVMDGLNRPIYYHRKGQPSSDGILNIMLANDDQSGPVKVKFVNGYFEVMDR